MWLVKKALNRGDNFDLTANLRDAGVPFSPLDDACKSCEAPCDVADLGTYPSLFIDHMSNLLGRVKPFGRQVIISTGRNDWPKEVTDVSGSLAYFLRDAHDDGLAQSNPRSSRTVTGAKESSGSEHWPGFLDSSAESRLMILNGSHRTASEDSTHHTVLVLPDYVFVNEVKESADGAKALWKEALDPAVGRGGRGLTGVELKSWPIPYDAVIMLCSHKRRDNRCAVTAPILENALTTVLNARSWEVHTEIELDADIPPLQASMASNLNPEERDEAFKTQLRGVTDTSGGKRALLLKVSHVGGHKLAGNVVIYTPTGAGIWYGRVTPNEVTAIVDETIIGGKILPELLRTAINVPTSGGKCFNEW